ncbi:DUF4062 domain-containing protein [Sphingorhabdus sp. YGSMI21]|uniref:DUF4062 domain-containing protein n=1 Tax=Sphingorhabdus sp. YGSMI21 TaxID=2077182 RepID=UPI000C1F585B|nr:DUF4062 domain-containing protein [Sphingorhabdus sp. YGSMI21]ATW04421.1 hypothetical protein CHN51_13425 [Sphingorhabdus sp. YGSMI21]
MANPRVFVSSTCYDLRYIRENLQYFIKTLGYEPILSEEGNVYYDPQIHVQDACLTEIPNCQMLVLIIGGRHGSDFKSEKTSITNHEFREAIKNKIPIFALVEQAVLGDYYLYRENLNNGSIKEDSIRYPNADSTRIFKFIDEVQSSTVNNALVPFRDFNDIENYLRQQWAGMLFSFLIQKNQQDKVEGTLDVLTTISSRVEMLSSQILKSVGTPIAKITATLYDLMLEDEGIRDLAFMGARPRPEHILKYGSYRICFKAIKGKALRIEDDEDEDGNPSYSVGGDGSISKARFNRNSNQYEELRKKMIDVLEEGEVQLEQYLLEASQGLDALIELEDEA